MPYKSDKQRKYFHYAEKAGKISPKVVKEFDEASKGMKLPERVKKTGGPSGLDDVPQLMEPEATAIPSKHEQELPKELEQRKSELCDYAHCTFLNHPQIKSK